MTDCCCVMAWHREASCARSTSLIRHSIAAASTACSAARADDMRARPPPPPPDCPPLAPFRPPWAAFRRTPRVSRYRLRSPSISSWAPARPCVAAVSDCADMDRSPTSNTALTNLTRSSSGQMNRCFTAYVPSPAVSLRKTPRRRASARKAAWSALPSPAWSSTRSPKRRAGPSLPRSPRVRLRDPRAPYCARIRTAAGA
mmetsp:Transcript_7668/g.25019  ORF Transcript_7668/g.25019 Transcript_7668/m.25019 type:complete len:200 (+) Transcript_7668:651-1250(+)